MSFNKIIVVGNLGRDPEMRYTPQGTPVCTFSIASNERRRDRAGDQQDVTTWFRVTVWGKQAETVSKFLFKGKSVYVEGRLHVEEWTDRDGKQRYTLEINATDVQFIDGARSSSGEREGIPVQQYAGEAGSGQGANATAAAMRPAGGRIAPRAAAAAAELDEDSIPF
jgi:single-strand DNA-binding protein